MPSIESSSSNPKSNGCSSPDTSHQHARPNTRTRIARDVGLTEAQVGSSAGSCQTARYGWLSACSQVMRFAGSKCSSCARRSIASGFARGKSVENGTRGLIGSERM